MLWRQRSRVSWMKYGDKNTRFFHEHAKMRGQQNMIKAIVEDQGIWHASTESIGIVFCDYFQGLFASNGLHEAGAVTEKYWGVVGDDVVGFCLNVLNGGASVKEINHTLLTLIPKVDKPTKVTEFRPISLCTVIYKMISKTIVNRLKPIMPLIISEFQSAFVPTRLITDNIIAAFESIHAIKRRGGSKLKKMVLKLDMSKAYDRVEWTFIEAMLKRLGFNDKWVELIMDCISTVTYSVQVRGVASGMIVPSRGMHQGDPLSPYMFLICAKGLSALLSNALRIKRISGISVAQEALTISHLFFADDSLLFCNAHLADCAHLLQILSMYERATGQKLILISLQHVLAPTLIR
ncbi:hypothetical protein L3X38_028847 [Prunus dulcis]|uniref:Reverse transcriptase domain-containing protein n=1 Tax=Prunus dulcis TaxID=3755 RepID=A0AAD4VQJ3_PRUDU|nr:hypothetical protein L3X38_028847 [Prunus dulcis]